MNLFVFYSLLEVILDVNYTDIKHITLASMGMSPHVPDLEALVY